MNLSLADFAIKYTSPDYRKYYECVLEDDREVCLEPCAEGCCVGVYRGNLLVVEKECTNISHREMLKMTGYEVLMAGVRIANRMIVK